MGGACSQKLKSRRGLPSSSGRFCIGWDAATLTQDPIGQQKPASPGLQLVGEIHYCWGGSNLGWVISAKRPRIKREFLRCEKRPAAVTAKNAARNPHRIPVSVRLPKVLPATTKITLPNANR